MASTKFSAEELSSLVEFSLPVLRNTFNRNVSRNDRLSIEKYLGYSKDFPISKGWHVKYFKGKIRGRVAYFIQHSAIKYVFLTKNQTRA